MLFERLTVVGMAEEIANILADEQRLAAFVTYDAHGFVFELKRDDAHGLSSHAASAASSRLLSWKRDLSG